MKCTLMPDAGVARDCHSGSSGPPAGDSCKKLSVPDRLQEPDSARRERRPPAQPAMDHTREVKQPSGILMGSMAPAEIRMSSRGMAVPAAGTTRKGHATPAGVEVGSDSALAICPCSPALFPTQRQSGRGYRRSVRPALCAAGHAPGGRAGRRSAGGRPRQHAPAQAARNP